jgi:hypothetical protein
VYTLNQDFPRHRSKSHLVGDHSDNRESFAGTLVQRRARIENPPTRSSDRYGLRNDSASKCRRKGYGYMSRKNVGFTAWVKSSQEPCLTWGHALPQWQNYYKRYVNRPLAFSFLDISFIAINKNSCLFIRLQLSTAVARRERTPVTRPESLCPLTICKYWIIALRFAWRIPMLYRNTSESDPPTDENV